jgi:hypothetical protein
MASMMPLRPSWRPSWHRGGLTRKESTIAADDAARAALVALEQSGWLVRWELLDDDDPRTEWTLTPLAAERLGVHIVEWGNDEVPLWMARPADPKHKMPPIRITHPAWMVSGDFLDRLAAPSRADDDEPEHLLNDDGKPVVLLGYKIEIDRRSKRKAKAAKAAKVQVKAAKGKRRGRRGMPYPAKNKPSALPKHSHCSIAASAAG